MVQGPPHPLRSTLLRSGESMLAALFPADCLLCGRPLPWRQRGGACLLCWRRIPWRAGIRRLSGPLSAMLWAADYEGSIRRLIQAFKFRGIDYLDRWLAGESIARILPLLGSAVPHPDLVIPVPLHWWRRMRRGYNQSLLLARTIAGRSDLPVDPHVLVRRRAGRRQLGLSRAARLRSLHGAYAIRSSARPGASRASIRGKRILLVDDVVTTGATLQACALELQRAGALSVVGFTIARTPMVSGRGPLRNVAAGIRNTFKG